MGYDHHTYTHTHTHTHTHDTTAMSDEDDEDVGDIDIQRMVLSVLLPMDVYIVQNYMYIQLTKNILYEKVGGI